MILVLLVVSDTEASASGVAVTNFVTGNSGVLSLLFCWRLVLVSASGSLCTTPNSYDGARLLILLLLAETVSEQCAVLWRIFP